MKRWQYWDAKLIYSGIGMMIIPLMIRFRITWYHLIYANRNMPFGGMEIGSKSTILDLYLNSPYFLPHTMLSIENTVEENIEHCRAFMKKNMLEFPLIAKPDLGCVGHGVRKVSSMAELRGVLEISPVSYMVQEYCTHPYEYSIYYRRLPGEECGKVTGVTLKILPDIVGDGRSTLQQLIERDPRYQRNSRALIRHLRDPGRIVAKGIKEQVLVQGSHTYGAIFKDISYVINGEMHRWVDAMAKQDPSFCIGRFDIRATGRCALRSGEGVKILEINGCMSEPIHAYDDCHSLRYGIQEFFKVYKWGFTIAASNRLHHERPPYLTMNRAFLKFFADKRTIMEKIG